MRILKVSNIESFARKIIPKQPQKNKSIVESIINDVKQYGDSALKKYEKKLCGAKLSSLQVSKNEIQEAYVKVSTKDISAIKIAKSKLEKSEKSLKGILKNQTLNSDGIKISKTFLPIHNVGCYVPGGLAKYPSSVVMSVVPAKVAGVKRIVVVSPPNKSGKLDPLTIVAADICGATEIFKTGGAQSIAALSFGTKTISPVDKIVGPGGAFVTLAKSLVSDNTSIDMLAGPTELGIIADSSANPEFIALDLISQAEHSSDTFCYLVTNSEQLAKQVDKIISGKVNSIERSDLVKTSLKKNGFIAICKNLTDMVKLANALSPEHLQIMTRDYQKVSSNITSAGLILMGQDTPSSASDYVLGSNHILPTNRFARVRGSLSVLDFVKVSTKVVTTKKTLKKLAKDLKSFTDNEGLPNHYEAVRGRIK